MTKLKGKLGGFKKSEVDEHIKQIQQAQEAELEDFTKKIATCRREKEALEQELSNLADQDTDFTSVILLELALNNVERVTGYINQTAEEDVLAIRESSRRKLLALEDVILMLDKDIQDAKEKIENEIKNILEVANGEERKTSAAFGDKESLDNINIGKVYPIADWLKNNKSEPSNKEKEFWGEQLEIEPQKIVQPITADGTTEVPLNKPEKDGNNLQDTRTKQPDQVSEAVVDKSSNNLGKENGASQADFWDSSTDWEEEADRSTEEIAATVDTEAKPMVPDSTKSEEHEIVDKSEDFFNYEESLEIELPPDPAGNEDQSRETENSEHLPSQAGVRQEIETVRYKYVLGKIAGEDLLDDSGRLIIRKSDKITESVVEIAQREGKLADLIIHMILPGQEE